MSHSLRVLAWAVASTVMALASFVIAAVAGSVLSGLLGGTTAVRLGAALAAWVPLATAAPLIVAAGMIPEALRGATTRSLAIVIALGTVTAGASAGLLVLSAEARYAIYDSEYVGLSQLIPPAVVLLAACTSTALAMTGAARAVSIGGMAVAIGGLLLLWLDSLPGLADGISQSGVPAALAFLSSAAFGGMCLSIVVRRRWLLPRARARPAQ
ncbi:MAG TPA: hypothetical protein VNW68_08340 [Candidatus Limnocylindria bacterium]|nr:hypothetical protein [Candidatus Limnocylindria bacterium]